MSYLAQKIVLRLLDDGHNCDYVESVNVDNLTKSMILFCYQQLFK